MKSQRKDDSRGIKSSFLRCFSEIQRRNDKRLVIAIGIVKLTAILVSFLYKVDDDQTPSKKRESGHHKVDDDQNPSKNRENGFHSKYQLFHHNLNRFASRKKLK